MNTTDKYLIESTVENMPPEGLDLSKYEGVEIFYEDWSGERERARVVETDGGEFELGEHIYTASGFYWDEPSDNPEYNIRRILNPDYKEQPEPAPFHLTREMELHAQFMAARIMAGVDSEYAAKGAQKDLDAFKAHWRLK